VRDIAARAGVTTGAIYAHYDDVASLLADAAGRVVDHVMTTVAEVMPDELGAVARGIITGTASRGLSREQSLLLEAFIAARREAHLRRLLGEVLRERLFVLERAVREAQAAGRMHAHLPPDAVAWFLYLLPIGLLAGRAVDLPAPSTADSAEVIAALFVGLEPDGQNPTA
jgi:AcrR family transcriptional regulator